MKKELKVWLVRHKKLKNLELPVFDTKKQAREWIVGENDYEAVHCVIRPIKNKK